MIMYRFLKRKWIAREVSEDYILDMKERGYITQEQCEDILRTEQKGYYVMPTMARTGGEA